LRRLGEHLRVAAGYLHRAWLGVVLLEEKGQPTAAYQYLLSSLDLEPSPEVAAAAVAALRKIEALQKRRVGHLHAHRTWRSCSTAAWRWRQPSHPDIPEPHKDSSKEGGQAMGLIITLVIGGIVGWLASILMKTNAQMGILANVLVGIVGSVLGGWMFGVLGLGLAGTLGSWIMSIIGAVVLIAILKALKILK
jgi:uncharacterized membrane protein YeaQ/YmgE (transglycosylase-associated protein family)